MNLPAMIRMVLWSFFGVRRGAAHQADLANVKLSVLPVVAITLAGGFGLLLFSLVKLAVTVAH
jgi:hypothetical protein